MLFRISLFLFCIVCIEKSSGIRVKCNPGIPCTPLTECPSLLKLIRSGDLNMINQVQTQICSFIGRKSSVCCKDKAVVVPTPTDPDISNLFPTKCGTPEKLDRIIGGELAPRAVYPWMVAMGYESIGVNGIEFLCAGSLISNRYVLTAAHCLDKSLLGTKRLKVLHVGEWDLTTNVDCEVTIIGSDCSPPHVLARVDQEIVHPLYNQRAESSDDIALVRLAAPVAFASHIQPICLPSEILNPEDPANENRTLIAAGWGVTENFRRSDQLLRVNLDLRSGTICSNSYQQRFVSKQICVGGKEGVDTCKGDSGAPLMMPGVNGPPFRQVGIVSYGPWPCGKAKSPAVYTSVSEYLDWIRENVKP